MRGKVHVDAAPKVDRGITPAHAGKRASCWEGFIRDWDHPRTCGEKLEARRDAAEARGSPPRMRGKVPGFAADAHE